MRAAGSGVRNADSARCRRHPKVMKTHGKKCVSAIARCTGESLSHDVGAGGAKVWANSARVRPIKRETLPRFKSSAKPTIASDQPQCSVRESATKPRHLRPFDCA